MNKLVIWRMNEVTAMERETMGSISKSSQNTLVTQAKNTHPRVRGFPCDTE